jgi:hypothetical protein
MAMALYILRPLTTERTREVIVEPARATGVAFESESLVDTLVESTSHAEGGLPLLEFTLAELWQARDPERNLITASALESLGGVAGALARHADAVIAGLLPGQRIAARRLLTRLVTPEGTRARRSEAELCGGDPVARAALEALVHARLVVTHEAEEESAYEVAHEVLIDGWGTLRDWLREDADRRVLRERLVHAVREWERLGQSPETLWSGRQLAEAAALSRDELTPREDAFLASSRRKLRRARRIRNGLIAAVVLTFLSFYGVVELKARSDLSRKVGSRMTQAARALEDARGKGIELKALRGQAFALFDARERAAGERTWVRAMALGHQVAAAFTEASRELEAALVLDPGRSDVRSLFAEVLLDRAFLAEHSRRFADVDELVQRLHLYDESGDLRRRWSAPATLSVESSPAGASVSLDRFVQDEWGRLRQVEHRAVGESGAHGPATPRGAGEQPGHRGAVPGADPSGPYGSLLVAAGAGGPSAGNRAIALPHPRSRGQRRGDPVRPGGGGRQPVSRLRPCRRAVPALPRHPGEDRPRRAHQRLLSPLPADVTRFCPTIAGCAGPLRLISPA